MHVEPFPRLIFWLLTAIIVLSGVSLAADNWLKPHWDVSQRAWMTSTSDSYWDYSAERWQADTNAMYWNEDRGVWMYSNGVYFDDSRGVWRDPAGDYIDPNLKLWVNSAQNAYWDSPSRTWRPLVVAQ